MYLRFVEVHLFGKSISTDRMELLKFYRFGLVACECSVVWKVFSIHLFRFVQHKPVSFNFNPLNAHRSSNAQSTHTTSHDVQCTPAPIDQTASVKVTNVRCMQSYKLPFIVCAVLFGMC